MKKYSFNDFRYICYVEGKEQGVKRLLNSFATEKEIKKQLKVSNIHAIYDFYITEYAKKKP
ncbi:hypothetical protein WN83_11715 [Listeria monocytogenes]|nr:hypothetical protein [Listeria monocytogenes]EAD4868478.1 hypothetical protein [Listeria monocytogenes]